MFLKRNIATGPGRSRECANCSSGSATTKNGSSWPAPAKRTTPSTKLLEVEDLIDGCTTADDADRSKPAPDIFTAALEKVNTSPDEAITVGDTRFDVEAAAKAGLKTIALTCGGTDDSVLHKAGAIAVFRDPAHLLAKYDKLTSDF
jgi:phosphoglycolate phosphatase-like HAD superfamily hydrolase